jgi:CRISPR-associated exonuclease Cas4
VIALFLLLIGAVLLYVLVGQWTRGERSALGLSREVIVSADDSALGTPTLRSARYGLVGRPDQIVRVGRMLIPVEHKPKARRMQQSHVLQLAAQCLLVHEVYGVRPSYGLLVLANGTQERVEFTPALERHLLHAMAQMRAVLRTDGEPGPRWVAAKCRACGFRETCWELAGSASA